MIGTIPILLLGTLILVLCARVLLQRDVKDRAAAVTIEDYSAARAAVDSMFAETSAITRIFATEDMKFISGSGARDVQRFFLKERKRLAIQWLRMTQRQVAHLMDLHLKLASYTYEPSPRFELKLTVNYLCFIFASNGLLVLLWIIGPFEAVRIVSYTVRAAEHFCAVFSIRLGKTDPIKLSSAR